MFDFEFPYNSKRMPLCARNVVATSQPLAAQAGLNILRRGGNAVDAAVAAAAALTVVEPTSNGIGSDAFAIVWDGEKLHGINGSGHSPAGWTPEKYSEFDTMPELGWMSVTVPGAVSVWSEMSMHFGRLDCEDLVRPAINYASNGFPVSPITARAWQAVEGRYRDFPEFCRVFLPGGRAPRAGEIFRCEDQAETLEQIATTCAESFYRGDLASRIVNASKEQGGCFTLEDFSTHSPEWVTPMSVDYRDYTLHELPPNGQGLAALIALGILDNFDMDGCPVDSVDSLHIQIEAMKAGFAVISAHLADVHCMKADPEDFLSPEFLASQAGHIKMDRAQFPRMLIPTDNGTVYLTTADSSGMMVSFIQSNYMGFGSGIVIPGTGISMQNRGCGFTLEEGHPNQVDGHKRPYHTIIPGFVTKDGEPVMSFGVMGGHMQPQGHVQMMVRIFDYHQNPQAASDAPRWHLTEDMKVAVEPGFDPLVLKQLASRGHEIITDQPQSLFGGAQLIYRDGDHYIAASDHRKDGQAVGF